MIELTAPQRAEIAEQLAFMLADAQALIDCAEGDYNGELTADEIVQQRQHDRDEAAELRQRYETWIDVLVSTTAFSRQTLEDDAQAFVDGGHAIPVVVRFPIAQFRTRDAAYAALADGSLWLALKGSTARDNKLRVPVVSVDGVSQGGF